MHTTHPPLVRMTYIDEQLKHNRYPNCFIIAKEFEVNRKTILKDIDYMRDQYHAPIGFDSKKNGYYYTEKNFSFPAINLTEGELFSLLIAEKVLKQYENTPFESDLTRIFEKICQFLPDNVKINPAQLSDSIKFKPEIVANINKDIYDKLSKAVKDEVEVEISYHSFKDDEGTKRTIQPYYIINKLGDWYIFAFCKLRKDFRVFAIQRIKEAKILDEVFIKEEINSTKIVGNALDIIYGKGKYVVELLIEYPFSLYMRERKWHPTQKIKENKDKSINISFTLNSLREIFRWVMSRGADVKVLKPALLAEMVMEEAKAISKIYKK